MKKIKVEWLAAILVIVVMGAVLMFLMFSNLAPGNHEPDIELPQDPGFGGEQDTASRPTEPSEQVLPVTITKQNAQSVVGSLSRPESYFRRIETVVSYREESRVTTSEQWVTPERVLTRTTNSAGGAALYTQTYEGTTIMWSEGEGAVTTISESADAVAGIPTYEDVLELPEDSITAAGYREYGEEPSIYIETYDRELLYTLRYYISTETGLLQHAETYSGGELVYSASVLEFSLDTSSGEAIQPPN